METTNVIDELKSAGAACFDISWDAYTGLYAVTMYAEDEKSVYAEDEELQSAVMLAIDGYASGDWDEDCNDINASDDGEEKIIKQKMCNDCISDELRKIIDACDDMEEKTGRNAKELLYAILDDVRKSANLHRH